MLLHREVEHYFGENKNLLGKENNIATAMRRRHQFKRHNHKTIDCWVLVTSSAVRHQNYLHFLHCLQSCQILHHTFVIFKTIPMNYRYILWLLPFTHLCQE